MKQTQLEVLNQRAKEYGSYKDNVRVINEYSNSINIKFINMRILETSLYDYYALTNITNNMMGLKIARLANATSIDTIEDCIVDYFNYAYLGIKDILSVLSITNSASQDEAYIWVEFTCEHVFLDIPQMSSSKNLKYIKECINIIKEKRWNTSSLHILKESASAVIDLYHQSQNTIDNEDVNLFNYKEKLNKRGK